MDRATSTQSADVSRIIAKSFSSWVIHRKPGLLSYSVCKRTACSDPVKAGKIPTPFFCVFARSEKRTFLKASVAQSVSLASTQGISPFVETSLQGFGRDNFNRLALECFQLCAKGYTAELLATTLVHNLRIPLCYQVF